MGSIVWVASYPKSGNTWLRIFLLNLFAGGHEPVPLSQVSRMSTGDTVLDWYRAVDARDPADWTTAEVAQLRLAAQRHLAGLKDDSIFVKTHAALVPMAGQPPFDMTVSGGAVYIVRNPLDIAPSYARHLGLGLDEIIEIMATPDHMLPRTQGLAEFIQGGWSQNVASWTARPSPAIHVVRYEDMVVATQASFAAICAFLHLETTRERLKAALDHAALPTLTRLEGEQGFSERTTSQARFFGEGGVDAWKTALSPAQVERVVTRHRAQMARFGYVPEGR